MRRQEGGSFGRALWIGTLVGAVLIIAAVGYLFATGGLQQRTSGSGDVIVALILPDEEGVVTPRTITRYAVGVPGALHIDPATPARIPATSYDMLRDAYSFGGGSGLARTVHDETPPPPGSSEGAPAPSFVLVDHDAWIALGGSEADSAGLTIVVPEHMEVFDGSRVHTFTEGTNRIDPASVPALLNGAEYLSAGDSEAIRIQVAEELVRRLAATPDAFGSVETDLTAEEFAEWLGRAALGG